MTVIPADILEAEADGRIPDGIILSYLAQSRDTPALGAILFLGCLAAIIMTLRCYARVFLVKKFGLDDALAVFTMMLYIAFIALSVILIKLGSGRHMDYIQYVLDMPTVKQTEVLDYAAHILYTTALFVCRLSGLAFYNRVSDRHPTLQIVIKATSGFLVAAFLPQVFLLIFHCSPVTGLWPYAWQPGSENYTCLSWGLVYSVNSGLSLVCDILIFVIPAVIISQLHASVKRKLQLAAVMFPGVLVIVISSVRLYLVIKGQWATDGSWAYNPMLAIENSEIGGTLICLSIPALKPLFGSVFARLGYYSGSASKTYPTYDHSRGPGASRKLASIKALTTPSSRNDAYELTPSVVSVSVTAPQPTQQFTANGSAEDLLDENHKKGAIDTRLGTTGIRVTEEITFVTDSQKH